MNISELEKELARFQAYLAILPKCEKRHRISQAFIQTSAAPDGGGEVEEAVEDFTIIDDYDDLAYVQEMLAHQR